MAGRGYKTEGVVLRSFRLGEADRVLHLYTLARGRVGAVAKGIRRTKSRFGAAGTAQPCRAAPPSGFRGVADAHGRRSDRVASCRARGSVSPQRRARRARSDAPTL